MKGNYCSKQPLRNVKTKQPALRGFWLHNSPFHGTKTLEAGCLALKKMMSGSARTLFQVVGSPAEACSPSREWLAKCAEDASAETEPEGLLNIAPSGGACAALSSRWRRVEGLWEGLCRKGLWQGGMPDGTPLHDEDSAVAGIFNALGDQWTELADWREAALHFCGVDAAWGAITHLGRGRMNRNAWRMWKIRLSGEVSSDDDDPRLFADGWALRGADLDLLEESFYLTGRATS